jgi:predicted MPP superfamily phosphohydrolase/tetratricopeptide (TPR) repeat protein
MQAFRILHISDLHFSPKSQWDSAGVLSHFALAVKELCDQDLRPNVIALTGDIAYSGSADEYDLARKWLDDTLFSSALGFTPQDLLFVPGNHDVSRRDVSNVALLAQKVLRGGASQDTIASILGEVDGASLLARHKAYMAFCAELSDGECAHPWWRRDYECGAKSIRIVGLCSSFLSYDNDDKGRLLVGKYQYAPLLTALPSSDFTVGLVHHPLEYLQDFDSHDLNRALENHVDVLLRGHLHDESARNHVRPDCGYVELAAGSLYAGSAYPNAFHLVEYRPDSSELTVHLRRWHRERWIIDRNAYEGAPDGVVRIPFRSQAAHRPLQTDEQCGSRAARSESGAVAEEQVTYPLTAEGPGASRLPRFPLTYSAQHGAIRQTEREEASTRLRDERVIWLAADWDVGRRAFITSVLRYGDFGERSPAAFCINCDEADTVDSVLDCAVQQLGVTFQEFCDRVSHLECAVLIIEDVTGRMCAPTVKGSLTLPALVRTVLDYCPNLQVILVGRSPPPADSGFAVVTIVPLDQIEIRDFLNSHPSCPLRFDDHEILDRISMATEGIPHSLEKMVEALQFSSLNEVLSSLLVDRAQLTASQDTIPKSIVRSIERLVTSVQDEDKRSFRLLVALSVLEYGEELNTIRRMYSDAPFWETQAKDLLSHSLLDTMPVYSACSTAVASASSAAEARKLLRVPRAIRDFVKSRLTSDQLRDAVRAAANTLFGREWRNGRVRVRRAVTNDHGVGLGNEHIICVQLMRFAQISGEIDDLKKAVSLSLKYVKQLEIKERYRDAYLAAKNLASLIEEIDNDDDDLANERAECAVLGASSARMINKGQETIDLLTSVLVNGRILADSERTANIHLELALAYQSIGASNDAISSARKVMEIMPAKSAEAMQAKGIIAANDGTTVDLEGTLQTLEQRARRLGFVSVADNFALSGAQRAKDVNTKLERIARVTSGTGGDYNRLRAHVQRVNALLDAQRGHDVTPVDVKWINKGFAHFFSQRMSALFDQCHRALWNYCMFKKDYMELLRVFRHSSFLWRLRGEEHQERLYLEELVKVERGSIDDDAVGKLSFEIRYVDRRKVVLVIGVSSNNG